MSRAFVSRSVGFATNLSKRLCTGERGIMYFHDPCFYIPFMCRFGWYRSSAYRVLIYTPLRPKFNRPTTYPHSNFTRLNKIELPHEILYPYSQPRVADYGGFSCLLCKFGKRDFPMSLTSIRLPDVTHHRERWEITRRWGIRPPLNVVLRM